MLDLVWNHDFALTPNHLVFVLDPIQPNIRKVVLATHSLVDSLQFQPRKSTRFLLVPRDGGKPRIVEHEALLHFHLTNAYEDGTDTVIDLVRYGDWDELRAGTNSLRNSRLPDTRLMRYRISATGRVTEQQLAPHSVEFPQYDWRRSTRRHRYTDRPRRRSGNRLRLRRKLGRRAAVRPTHTHRRRGRRLAAPGESQARRAPLPAGHPSTPRTSTEAQWPPPGCRITSPGDSTGPSPAASPPSEHRYQARRLDRARADPRCGAPRKSRPSAPAWPRPSSLSCPSTSMRTSP